MSVSTKAKYLTVSRVFLKELQMKTKLITSRGNCLCCRILPQTFGLRLFFSLLIYQGLRQIEIIRLDVEDLDLTRQTALILGKGRDDKEIVDLHPQSVLALKNYMDIAKVRSGSLFTSMSNHNKNGRLTTKSLRELVKSTLTQLNINMRLAPNLDHFSLKDRCKAP